MAGNGEVDGCSLGGWPVDAVPVARRTAPNANDYGYYWWLRPNGRYFASGSFGQHIEVAPDKRTVVAIHSYWPAAFNDELIDHNDSVVDALITFAGSGPAR